MSSQTKRKVRSLQLLGGPGSGKSTTSHGLMYTLKKNRKEVECIQEYVKSWIHEGRAILDTDQIYLLSKQARKEQILVGKTDFIVSDSPIIMSPTYEKMYTQAPYVCQSIVEKFQAEAKRAGVEYEYIYLNRTQPYNPVARNQNEKEAIEIDIKLKEYLVEHKIPFITVDVGENTVDEICERLGLLK